MKNIYLILSIIGFIAPNIFVVKESVASGNILLWRDPLATMSGMFANNISTAFTVDLMVVVLIYFFWTYHEAKQYHIKNLGLNWVLTMFFGLAGTFPLFLYWREKKMDSGK